MLGSGTIESACKQIVAQHLKRSGTRWYKRGASTKQRSVLAGKEISDEIMVRFW